MPALSNLLVVTSATAVALVACSKSSSDYKQQAGSAAASAPTGAGSSATGSGEAPSAADSAPSEPAAVVGPTKSASGALEVSGELTGTFEWKKKDQKAPISCAWSAEKEIGGLRVDLSDGAGHLITVAVDVPPAELGPARLDIMSTNLPGPQTAHTGFKVRGDDEGHITVTFDNTKLPEPATDPATAKKKKADKPPPSVLTIKGTLEVICPPKK